MPADVVEPNSTVVFVAKRVITMDPARPSAQAVAVSAGRVVAVGSLDEVRAMPVDTAFVVDDRFAASVLIAGFRRSSAPMMCRSRVRSWSTAAISASVASPRTP